MARTNPPSSAIPLRAVSDESSRRVNRDEADLKKAAATVAPEVLMAPHEGNFGEASSGSKADSPDTNSPYLRGGRSESFKPESVPPAPLSVSPRAEPCLSGAPLLDIQSPPLTAPRVRPPESPGDSIMSRQLSAPPTDMSFQTTFLSPGSIAQEKHPRGTRVAHAMIEEDNADDDMYGDDGYASAGSNEGGEGGGGAAAAGADASWAQHAAAERARLRSTRALARECDEAGAAIGTSLTD
jgi:hypothetical protein